MTNDDGFRSWAVREWIKKAENNTPLAKSIRDRKAAGRVLKKEHAKRLRSLVAGNGAKMRALKTQQAVAETAMRKRWEEIDAAADKKRWDFLLKQ